MGGGREERGREGHELDAALANSSTPTKLIHSLLTVVFEPHVIAASSALGSRATPALDTCFRKHNFSIPVAVILIG